MKRVSFLLSILVAFVVAISAETVNIGYPSGGNSDAIRIEMDASIVDISTGVGTLVLDEDLQELSEVEQATAQVLAAESKVQKQVHSITGD